MAYFGGFPGAPIGGGYGGFYGAPVRHAGPVRYAQGPSGASVYRGNSLGNFVAPVYGGFGPGPFGFGGPIRYAAAPATPAKKDDEEEADADVTQEEEVKEETEEPAAESPAPVRTIPAGPFGFGFPQGPVFMGGPYGGYGGHRHHHHHGHHHHHHGHSRSRSRRHGYGHRAFGPSFTATGAPFGGFPQVHRTFSRSASAAFPAAPATTRPTNQAERQTATVSRTASVPYHGFAPGPRGYPSPAGARIFGASLSATGPVLYGGARIISRAPVAGSPVVEEPTDVQNVASPDGSDA